MPQLENPKHEAFAYQLARGKKQKEAYTLAGYTSNDSAASRLAASPAVQARVEELKVEIYQKVNLAMAEPNEETFGSLREMGLTKEWCAHAFKEIYEAAVADGQYAPANAAVKNIQTLIEVDGAGTGEEDKDPESVIKVSEVTHMLSSLADVLNAAQGPGENEDPAVGAKDVTPSEDINPVALLQHLEEPSDAADHSAGTG